MYSRFSLHFLFLSVFGWEGMKELEKEGIRICMSYLYFCIALNDERTFFPISLRIKSGDFQVLRVKEWNLHLVALKNLGNAYRLDFIYPSSILPFS